MKNDGYELVILNPNESCGELIEKDGKYLINGEWMTERECQLLREFELWADEQVQNKLDGDIETREPLDDFMDDDMNLNDLIEKIENDPEIMTGSINKKTGKKWKKENE